MVYKKLMTKYYFEMQDVFLWAMSRYIITQGEVKRNPVVWSNI